MKYRVELDIYKEKGQGYRETYIVEAPTKAKAVINARWEAKRKHQDIEHLYTSVWMVKEERNENQTA